LREASLRATKQSGGHSDPGGQEPRIASSLVAPRNEVVGGEEPQSIHHYLRRFAQLSNAPHILERQEEEERVESGEYDMEQVFTGELTGDEDSRFFLVRQRFPLAHRQGTVELGEVMQTSSRHIAFSACDTELQDFDPRRTLFVDTETIGLAGGTGTVAFLIGVGYFEGDDFVLDQCFMRDYDDEEAMLRFLGERFQQADTVVSYNGKSFDLPLLRTRFIQHRLPFRLAGLGHFDLVHAVRRIWKRRLSDCSLGNIEREILGIERHGDIPSYLIPQMWFDYLRRRDARPLKPVFYHHQMDILSLVALTARLSQCLEAPDGEGFHHGEDQLSVVRLHFRQKQFAEVVAHAQRFLSQPQVIGLRVECLQLLALACRRLADYGQMQQAWETLLDECPDHLEACVELVKHHEHRTRDLACAHRLCVLALEQLCDPGSDAYAPLQHRLARLQRKLGLA
jgi:uncharacterized protein YprB with RNaseH-like and TPR domain